jgi:copper chaperone CopZ
MQKQYQIEGMTCGGCVANVQKKLSNLENVQSAEIQLASPQGKITFLNAISLDVLQYTLGDKYRIKETKEEKPIVEIPVVEMPVAEINKVLPEKSVNTYKPLILIVTFIAGVSLLAQYPFADFSGMLWMRHFMAGFFIVFAFFKLLNLEGFANSYRMYDIIAARYKGWGYVYPFVELALGVLYLINFVPFYTNIVTAIVLGVSSIGVIESNWNKRQIKCACLGDVFNLPMSTVTIVEDLTMVGMAIWMLFVMQ